MASPNKKTRYDFEHVNEIIEKEQWSELSTLLQDGGLSDAEQCGAVEAASKHCAESIFLSLISPHCTSSQLHSALPHLASRGLWRAVGHVLQRGVSTALLIWSIKQAVWQSAQQELLSFILPHCAEDQMDSVLTVLVEQGAWLAVVKVLGRGVSDSKKRWAVLEACKHCEDEDRYYTDGILSHCPDDMLDSVLTVLVEQGAWLAVVKVLGRGVSDSKKRWAVLEACKHCLYEVKYRDCDTIFNNPQNYIAEEILPHCADDMLDSVVTILAERHRWWSAVSVLERDVSDSKKRWVVQKALEDVENGLFQENFNKRRVPFLNIVAHCADDQMDDVLKVLVTGRQWCNVGEALKRNVSDSVKRLAVQEACAHHTNIGTYLINEILPHCADDMLDSVVTILAERHLWRSAVSVLERGVSDSKKRWVVQKALEDVENSLFKEDFNIPFQNIVAHCADDQMDDVMEVLVKGRQWRNVREALKRNVSDSVKLWAVKEACTHHTNIYTYLINEILPHCADDMLDSVVTILAKRHLWRSAVSVLERGVSDSKKRWVVQKALEDVEKGIFKEDFNNLNGSFINIVGHCADDQMDDVLKVLVKEWQWRNVGEALKRNVSDSVKRWAVQEACAHYEHLFYDGDDDDDDDDDGDDDDDDDDDVDDDDDYILINYILPQCADDHLQSVLPTLLERNLFNPVRYVLKRKVSDVEHQHCVQTVFMRARESLIKKVLSCYDYDAIRLQLGALASRKLWKLFLMLMHRFTIDTLRLWAIVEDCSEPKERVFWDMVSNPCDGVKELSLAQWRSVTWSDPQYSLKDCLHWDTLLCEVLCEALLATVREIWLCGREKEVDCWSHTAVEEARSVAENVHQQLNQVLMYCKSSNVSALLPCIHRLCQQYAGKTQSTTREPPAGEADPAENSSRKGRSNPNEAIEEEARYGENGSSRSPLFQWHFLKYITREYYRRKAWTRLTDAVLVVLTTTPVVPGVQSVALRIMVREKRWDVIRHACLSCVCEQDRRQVFQAAVKQRQWGAVKRWADDSLYDDQRLWALGEAKEEKRWDVYLKLAGHGLNEGERMGVLYRVALHADWKLVRHMVNTVADVAYMNDLLTNTRPARQPRNKPCRQRIEQLAEFEEALKKDTNTLKTLKTAAKRGKWQVVLYNIRHKPDLQHARRALKAAVFSEAWQAVIQLVRLETDVTRRDSLFRDMVRQQQWAVCRELLDQGVSDDLCVEALNDLMEHRQWTLVAMVMRCPMSEERRTEMMYRALMMREGSVVWQCIKSLQRPLSSEQRENIFQLAFNREVWQAVKPLVEKKDETGIRHRDTALLEAIEQHQWDVVDHCQRHHADINMKDKHGHTPIHRAAWEEDWEAVKELTVRDGDPNLLDRWGLSVLHRAIEAEQWDLVKLLIQFHGDIHRPAHDNQKNTALNMLIDARQIDVIQSTFMWCADQWKGVNGKGETTLHAACISGCPDILHDLIARRVDPLALTLEGDSALCYAVLCKDSPQRMVAECIKLGFSVHQPHIPGIVDIEWNKSIYTPHSAHREMNKMFFCPFIAAVFRGLPVVTQMLFESGACSNRQLFMLTRHLVRIIHSLSIRRALDMSFSELLDRTRYNYELGSTSDRVPIKNVVANLREMSSTPRSLVSTCRLVISRRLTLSKTRHRDIAQLPLSPMLKNYLMFTDLTDPGYVGDQE